MFNRLARSILQLLISFDQLVCVIIRSIPYIFGFGVKPDADETISSWVGRNSVAGKRWAKIAEKVIDTLFTPGHCRRAIERYGVDK